MKVEIDPLEIYKTPQLQSPSLIVGWQTQDVGKLGSKVIDFLNEKRKSQEVPVIKPLGFFPLGAARFKHDLLQVPESKFWACEEVNLLILKSDEPVFEQYRFLNTVLDFAESYCHVKELYPISGVVSFIAHTSPRRILTVFMVGLYGNFGQTNYAATKGGVITMTKTWARELGRYGIRVNCVAPGFIATEILKAMPEKVVQGMVGHTPLGRMGQPEDIANAYYWLASDEAGFVHGAVLSVDGGLVIGT